MALIQPYSTSAAKADVGVALLAAWGESHRRYHTTNHLVDVLRRVDALAAHADNADAVRLAAWFHDVVYAGTADDEAHSAQRAETDLAALDVAPPLIAEVTRLVRLTTSHNPAPGDRNGETLCDADLAVLAAPPQRYRTYTTAVRAEYRHLPDTTFRAGRAQILTALLQTPSIYRTPHARQHWEHQARTNLTTELHHLTTSTNLTPAAGDREG